MPVARTAVPWAALAAALGMLLLASRLVLDLREQVDEARNRAAVAEDALATATAAEASAALRSATATAFPLLLVGEAREALDRALKATLAALQEPVPARIEEVRALYASEPLAEVLPELEYLQRRELRLGERSGYEIQVHDAESIAADTVRLRTKERWTYDERDAQDVPVRCFRETYRVAYVLHRGDDGWRIQELRLEEPAERQPCDE